MQLSVPALSQTYVAPSFTNVLYHDPTEYNTAPGDYKTPIRVQIMLTGTVVLSLMAKSDLAVPAANIWVEQAIANLDQNKFIFSNVYEEWQMPFPVTAGEILTITIATSEAAFPTWVKDIKILGTVYRKVTPTPVINAVDTLG